MRAGGGRRPLPGIALALALGLSLAGHLWPGSYTAEILRMGLGGGRAETVRWLRRLYASELSGGNVFLRFVGFDPGDAADRARAASQYFQAVYALHPRRAYVAGEHVTIKDGADVLRRRFRPDALWLRQHGISDVVEIRLAEDGQVRFAVQPVGAGR